MSNPQLSLPVLASSTHFYAPPTVSSKTIVSSSLLANTDVFSLDQISIDELPTWKLPNLNKAIPDPIRIRSVELLKTQGQLMLVVTAQDGTRGVTQCNERMQNLSSLLNGLVIEHFTGKDARDLPQLVDNALSAQFELQICGHATLELHWLR